MAPNKRAQRFCNTEDEIVKFDDDYKRKLEVLNKFEVDCKRRDLASVLVLQANDFRDAIYRTSWNVATAEFRKRKSNPKNYPVVCSGGPDEYHIALICYTMDTFYSLFNRRTREICTPKDYERYPYHSFFHLLLKACQTIKSGSMSGDQILYRGDIRKLHYNDGQKVLFQQFLSTSSNYETAAEFSGSPDQGSVFAITKWRPGEMCTKLDNHSMFPQEQEVLIWPFELFICTRTYKNEQGKIIIVLQA